MALPAPKTTYLYALCNPGTRTVRYVGKSGNPKRRLREHIRRARRESHTHISCWIRQVLSQGAKPELFVIGEIPLLGWQDYEKNAIAAARALGMDLTNLTDGGEGVPSAAMKGRTPWNKGRKSPETSGTNHHTFGKPFSAETRTKLSLAGKGKPAWNKGQKTDEKTLVKLSGIRLRSKRVGAKSKFIGVYWDKHWPGWVVRIRVSGKYHYVGSFKNEIEAAKASDKAAIKIFGASTKLNFPLYA